MRKKMVAVLIFILMLLGAALYIFLPYEEEPAFYEEFKTARQWDQQCTKADITGKLNTPRVGNAFRTAGMKSEGGMLHLYTGSAEHTGGGEWSIPVEIAVGRDTSIEWKWTIHDPGDYQFWIRIKLNNNRSVYYKASDSRQPGFYRADRFIPYQGEKFRDSQGRLRFFPSTTLLVGRPANGWIVHKRAIFQDYQRSYGNVPGSLAITEITLGMMDDSKTNINEMGIEYVKILN